jgi:hypothetical protein
MSISKEPNAPRCVWCGTYGSPANFVIVFEAVEGNALSECEWCGTQEWFRRKASNGKED